MKAKRKRADVKAVGVAPIEAAAAPDTDASHATEATAEASGHVSDHVSDDVSDHMSGDATSIKAQAKSEVVIVKAEGVNHDADTHVHALPASCTVRDSVALKSALLDLLMERRTVALDVSGVERIDTAAMQVLCAFVRDRKAAGGSVQWIGTTESFTEAVRLLGLQRALDVPESSLLSVAA